MQFIFRNLEQLRPRNLHLIISCETENRNWRTQDLVLSSHCRATKNPKIIRAKCRRIYNSIHGSFLKVSYFPKSVFFFFSFLVCKATFTKIKIEKRFVKYLLPSSKCCRSKHLCRNERTRFIKWLVTEPMVYNFVLLKNMGIDHQV